MAIFYADNALLASRDPILLQRALDVTVGLFERVGLRTNTFKTKVMTCVPGRISTRHSNWVYNNSRVGLVSPQDQKRRQVTCDTCDKPMAAASLKDHMATHHGIYQSKVINRELLVER